MKKTLIKQWGENSAYSAKGHFKSADIKKKQIKILVIINVLFAVFSLLELGLPLIAKFFGLISLIASILLLISESQEDKSAIHMKIGDEYLGIHYELQRLYYEDDLKENEVNSILERIREINKKDKPSISQLAKKIAKKAIEDEGEMIKWWNK